MLSYTPLFAMLPAIYQLFYLAQEIVLVKLTKLLSLCSFAELYFCLEYWDKQVIMRWGKYSE